MKIAVSGSHQTGKTTLIDELAVSLPTFATIEEPYYQLEHEGHQFGAVPSLEDFEAQLDRSVESIGASPGDVLFDRCPCDMLAYLVTHDESEWFDLDRWIPSVRAAMRQLDLVAYVPIEDPDPIGVAAPEYGVLRSRVDDELRAMVLDDPWSLGIPAIEVMGSPEERARRVLEYLELGVGSR
jgi:hypothetical protein